MKNTRSCSRPQKQNPEKTDTTCSFKSNLGQENCGTRGSKWQSLHSPLGGTLRSTARMAPSVSLQQCRDQHTVLAYVSDVYSSLMTGNKKAFKPYSNICKSCFAGFLAVAGQGNSLQQPSRSDLQTESCPIKLCTLVEMLNCKQNHARSNSAHFFEMLNQLS